MTIAICAEYDIMILQMNNPSKWFGKVAIMPAEGVKLSGDKRPDRGGNLWRISFLSAEGARREPNLSGKRTEECLWSIGICVMSVAGVGCAHFLYSSAGNS